LNLFLDLPMGKGGIHAHLANSNAQLMENEWKNSGKRIIEAKKHH